MSTTTPRPAAHKPGSVSAQRQSGEEPTLGALVHDLSEQIPQLIRSEIRLAQAEVTEKGKEFGFGLGLFGASGYLAHLAAWILAAAAVLGLAEVMPGWAAALVVAGVLLVLAGISALLGKGHVEKAAPPVPERAIEGVQADIETLKGARP